MAGGENGEREKREKEKGGFAVGASVQARSHLDAGQRENERKKESE